MILCLDKAHNDPCRTYVPTGNQLLLVLLQMLVRLVKGSDQQSDLISSLCSQIFKMQQVLEACPEKFDTMTEYIGNIKIKTLCTSVIRSELKR